MKKLSLVLAAVVLSASISFAQDKAAANKTTPAGKGKGTPSTGTSTKATKPTPAKDSKPAKPAADKK